MTRKAVFDAIREVRGRGFTTDEVRQIDKLLDSLDVPRASTARQISDAGLGLIKQWEGLRLTAYPDPGTGGAPWTIGYGTTRMAGQPVRAGMKISQADADALLAADVATFAERVSTTIGDAATSQAQFDAMVSLAYNIGSAAFAGSTLAKKHRAGDFAGAAAEFVRWNRAGGRVMSGLVRRRSAEAALYRGEEAK